MNYRGFATLVATAGLAAGIVALAGPANANPTTNPTNLVDTSFGYTDSAAAFNLYASGDLVNIPPVATANCNSDFPYDSATLATLSLGVGTVKALKDKCSGDGDGDVWSSQSIASASLLGGKIKLGALSSKCSAVDGVGSVGSVVATINGMRPNSGTGQVLNIPGLAKIVINENHEADGLMWTDAVHISVLPVYVGSHQITPAQDIIIGQCSVGEFNSD